MFKNPFSTKSKEYNHFDLEKHSFDNAEFDYWRIVEVSSNEKKIVIRVRIEKPKLPDIDTYRNCISVTWKYEGIENGLPSSEDKQKQDDFEDAVADLTMYNNLSFLMGVSTGLDEKEWVLYAKDTEEFMKIFNESLKNSSEYPISIDFYEDENWTVWKEKLDFYQKSGQGS